MNKWVVTLVVHDDLTIEVIVRSENVLTDQEISRQAHKILVDTFGVTRPVVWDAVDIERVA